MGCGASAPVAPQNPPSKRAGKSGGGGGGDASLPATKPIDVAVLEERRAELQRQIDGMERQLAQSRVAFEHEQERQRQARAAQAAADQQRLAAAAPKAVAVPSDDDPALLALQSPKNPNSPGRGSVTGAPPNAVARNGTAAAPSPIQVPVQRQPGGAPSPVTPNPQVLGTPPYKPGPASPMGPPGMPRAATAGSPAAAPPGGAAVAGSPMKAPMKLNPIRQGSGAGAGLMPLDSQQQFGRSKTLLSAEKSDASDKRKSLRTNTSSKQDQMDIIRGGTAGGAGGSGSGSSGSAAAGGKLTRTGTGTNLSSPGGGGSSSSASAQNAKTNELKANLAAGGKRVANLSATKGEGGNYLNRVAVSKLRALNADDLKEIWDHYDADGNGYLDREEIKKLATECVERTLKMFADQMREANPSISEEQLKREVDRERYFLLPGKGDGKHDQTQDMIRMLVQKLDINRDGQVSRAELMMQWNSFSSDLFKVRSAEGSLDCSIM